MRSMLTKITAVVAAAFMILGFLAVPAATAQTYPPILGGGDSTGVNCDDPGPSISIDGTDVVGNNGGAIACTTRVTMVVNPTLYDGPPSVFGIIRRPLPALGAGAHTATITEYYTNGTSKSASIAIPAAAIAAANAKAGVTSVPAVSVPVPNLAFTGSSANLPVALGATLVGIGGLALLAARKRELSQA